MVRTIDRRLTRVALFTIILLGLVAARATAGAASLIVLEAEENPGGFAKEGVEMQQPFWMAGAAIHYFGHREMETAYGQMYGALIQGGRFQGAHWGWRIESGLWFALGDPHFPDSSWEVVSSNMQLLVAPLGGSVLYRFGNGGSGRALVPYIGLGLEGYFGFERTSVELSRGSVVQYNDTRYRQTFAGYALVGVTIGMSTRVQGVVEVRWTQGGRGSEVEPSFSDEEIEYGWLEVAAAVQRPDFDFTGWSIRVGVQW